MVALAAGTALLSPAVVAAGRASARAARPVVARHYVVRPGDTLWDIASRVAGPRGDPRPLVDRLLRENHLQRSDLAPGQILDLTGD
jgi:Tfp pilus assembly protein FimV